MVLEFKGSTDNCNESSHSLGTSYTMDVLVGWLCGKAAALQDLPECKKGVLGSTLAQSKYI